MRLTIRSRALACVLTVAAALAPTSPALAAAATLRVMPLGDSITFGKGDPAENGYRATLSCWLTQESAAVEFVGSQRNGATAHEGHPGWRIAQLTERIDGWMAQSRPDVVL